LRLDGTIVQARRCGARWPGTESQPTILAGSCPLSPWRKAARRRAGAGPGECRSRRPPPPARRARRYGSDERRRGRPAAVELHGIAEKIAERSAAAVSAIAVHQERRPPRNRPFHQESPCPSTAQRSVSAGRGSRSRAGPPGPSLSTFSFPRDDPRDVEHVGQELAGERRALRSMISSGAGRTAPEAGRPPAQHVRPPDDGVQAAFAARAKEHGQELVLGLVRPARASS